MPPTPPLKRAACVACTRAKRRCSKEAPECSRCKERDIPCRYPAPRVAPPYELVFSRDGAASKVTTAAATTDDSSLGEEEALALQTLSRPPKVCAFDQSKPWYLSPSSWIVEHPYDIPQQLNFSDEPLYYYINHMRQWLKQWTSEGHCPIFHRRLYVGNDLPDCVQDAYATLTAYQSKSEKTQGLVMRMVDRQANKIVQDQPPIVDDVGVLILETAAHLARTQALLVYKVIRLFDGDIRSREQAECHIDVLGLWARQLWQSAVLDVSSDHSLASQPGAVPTGQFGGSVSSSGLGQRNQLKTDGSLLASWQAWVFSESIRRTYLAATLTEAVYRMLKQGWAPCPGGILFTGGKGLWDSLTPYSWVLQGRECTVPHVRCLDGEKLFSEAMPSEVDDFTHVVLVVSYGLERFQQWRVEKELGM